MTLKEQVKQMPYDEAVNLLLNPWGENPQKVWVAQVVILHEMIRLIEEAKNGSNL